MTDAPKHTPSPIPPGGLTRRERFVLEWLSKEDFSTIGECEGQTLTVLLNCGLVEITQGDRGLWAKVSLTDAGRAAIAKAEGR